VAESRGSAARSYLHSSVESAPPIKLVRMLYTTALRLVEQAAAEKSPVAFVEQLTRVESIVAELRLALDHERAPEVSGKLEALYRFVEDELAASMAEQSTDRLPAARQVLATLEEAWRTVGKVAAEGLDGLSGDAA